MTSTSEVTLVIPGKNAGATLRDCLESVVPLLSEGRLAEIVFVNDGSTDDSGQIALDLGVRVVPGPGKGAALARNLGTAVVKTPLVWFVDADAVVEPEALNVLLAHMADPEVGAAGGSYGNMRPDDLLSCLIHEEIVQRHLAMPVEVNFLATFNVIYRKCALDQVGGFDERFVKAQDAELAFRVRKAGWKLHFDRRSRVKHFHETRLGKHLLVQARQGFWRTWLYLLHPEKAGGDSYAGGVDYLAPPLAMLNVALLVLCLFWPVFWPAAAGGLLLLAGLGLPMADKLVTRLQAPRYWMYVPFNFVRSFARGTGMSLGVADVALKMLRGTASRDKPGSA